MEELLVIQTLGVDEGEGSVTVSLASAAGVNAAGHPTRLSGRGASILTAIEEIRNRGNEEALFCSHISHVLLGEEAVLTEVLDYICRSHELRLSVPVYLLRGARAEDAVLRVGDADYGICDALSSVDADVKERGDGAVFTAAEIYQRLESCGAALVCAVELLPSTEKRLASGTEEREENTQEAPEQIYTVAAAGYAVYKEGRLVAALDRKAAVGANLLLNRPGRCELLLEGEKGPLTVSLKDGRCRLLPLFYENGALRGLELSVKAEAELLEGESGDLSTLSDPLERLLRERCEEVLSLSKRLRADFLGLYPRLELFSAVGEFEDARAFAEALPELELLLTVEVSIVRGGDKK